MIAVTPDGERSMNTYLGVSEFLSAADIDEARAEAIYDAMGPAIEASGGSAANTTVGVASLGAGAAFVGKVKDDQLGAIFAHDGRLVVSVVQEGLTRVGR